MSQAADGFWIILGKQHTGGTVDILDFVRQFSSDLSLAKKTKRQYGVLAFDLGEVGPTLSR
jgi:hypothetical protein